MNPLTDKFPTKIKINNDIFEINTDFRNCLKIIEAYEDEELTIIEKHMIMLKRLYVQLPDDLEQATLKGIKFLNCGEESNNLHETKRTYSFQKDGKYIYSAISQSHHLDLSEINYLHWWKFCYLFLDIKKDTTFSSILSLRQKKNKGQLNKEEKKVFMESREILDLEFSKEESEEVSEFMNAFNGGEDKRELGMK